MRKQKPMSLEEIKVESFITTLDSEKQKVVRGGSRPAEGTTSLPIFC
jgi:hypothetical protein